jgi:hypothetical protein
MLVFFRGKFLQASKIFDEGEHLKLFLHLPNLPLKRSQRQQGLYLPQLPWVTHHKHLCRVTQCCKTSVVDVEGSLSDILDEPYV